MQLINAPGKLVLPFSASGAKNTIPVASQIGIVAGAASLTDGFPPLTRTPLAAGGVPPSGLDMNGILYELSAILRWANAGAGYVYDGTFAADSNVGGYPKGARVLRSDGLGYWFNTTDNNTTDPEAAGTAPALAGWVPDYTNGVTAVTMTGSNVTLTAPQYGKPVIVISGLLTANLNLIFPSIVAEWTVINNTTGPYTVTCKTAAGTGVVVNSAQAIVGDGTNIYSAVNDAISLLGEQVASAAGTADALTATFSPAPRAWSTGVPFFVRAASANATTTPTFTPNSGTLTAKTIVKGANAALVAGDIAGAGHWLLMQYDATLDKVVLLNPATGVVAQPNAFLQSNFKNLALSADGISVNVAITADELTVEDASNNYKTIRPVNVSASVALNGANGLDTGATASNTWYSVWVIWNGTTAAALLSLSATAPTMPSGYTYKARIGWIRTDSTASKYPLRFKQFGRRVQYANLAGTNLTTLPIMASGTAGTFNTSYASVAVANFVPSTAGVIHGLIVIGGGGANTNGAGVSPNAIPAAAVQHSPNSTLASHYFSFVLESANIYWSSGSASNRVDCYGWDDNI